MGEELAVPLRAALLGAALLLSAGIVIGRTFEQRRRGRRARLLADLERDTIQALYPTSDVGAGRVIASERSRRAQEPPAEAPPAPPRPRGAREPRPPPPAAPGTRP